VCASDVFASSATLSHEQNFNLVLELDGGLT
jgi:hypothetical protein